jgi:serine/threonine-protein kinase
MQPAEQLSLTDARVQLALQRVGQVVRGRWHLDRVLGVGGTAAVYAATHRNGKRVALKVLHPELSAKAEMKQRFIDEGYVANCVGHPGAVSVIDDDLTDDGHVFLIMDLLDGQTLDQQVAEEGWLLPDRVLLIADAVLDILTAAHDKGIVHCDVKPDNIFVTRDGLTKLLDFGIAMVTTPGRIHAMQTRAPLGTPAFMPPEQARGGLEQLDGRTDVWALGATMFFLLTGRDVHPSDTADEELLAAMTKKAPSLGQIAPDLPPALVDLVDRALEFEREDRWPSAREMQTAVRRVQQLLDEEAMARSRSRTRISPINPTLVAAGLAPAANQQPLSRPPRPLVVVAASAAVSFLALLAARELGKTVRTSMAHISPMAIYASLWDRAVPRESWQSAEVGAVAPGPGPAATGSSPRGPSRDRSPSLSE